MTDCGIEYVAGASGDFHLVLSKGAVHFSNKKAPTSVEIMPSNFADLYRAANDLSSMLAKHSLHARSYSQPLLVVPTPT